MADFAAGFIGRAVGALTALAAVTVAGAIEFAQASGITLVFGERRLSRRQR